MVSEARQKANFSWEQPWVQRWYMATPIFSWEHWNPESFYCISGSQNTLTRGYTVHGPLQLVSWNVTVSGCKIYHWIQKIIAMSEFQKLFEHTGRRTQRVLVLRFFDGLKHSMNVIFCRVCSEETSSIQIMQSLGNLVDGVHFTNPLCIYVGEEWLRWNQWSK